MASVASNRSRHEGDTLRGVAPVVRVLRLAELA